MRSANTTRYLAMARLQRRLAYLRRAERTNGRIAMVAVVAATLAEWSIGHPLIMRPGGF
ncbi:MAG: chlorophyll a/b-binding protein [Parasynechococcus sp.]|jgi:hypothetical protein|uniref:chlorophyll a/b-binding protein n=1 Tax=Parasynechococcus sp. TaxID=3101203 RepID=UPI000DFD0648|nr:MAG: hypothetical protein DBW84_09715 [Synechococcus sp. MED-G70]HCX52739.1 hypothetical protein [Synechococcus sp. UBA9887]|tara:strand:+ start:137 stop:313 length:177 start_codon:yes stop_codon:yes gene_type:complete